MEPLESKRREVACWLCFACLLFLPFLQILQLNCSDFRGMQQKKMEGQQHQAPAIMTRQHRQRDPREISQTLGSSTRSLCNFFRFFFFWFCCFFCSVLFGGFFCSGLPWFRAVAPSSTRMPAATCANPDAPSTVLVLPRLPTRSCAAYRPADLSFRRRLRRAPAPASQPASQPARPLRNPALPQCARRAVRCAPWRRNPGM